MPTIHDQGVCVRQWDFSETSQTAAILTREHGMVRALAKGSRRDKSPFSGGLEVLARADLVAITKPAGSLATLTSWDLAETFPGCRRDLPRFHAGMYLAELVGLSVQDADPHPALYDALVEHLRAIGGVDAGPPERVMPAVVAFQWSLLTETGHRPEFARHGSTGAPLPEAPVYGFSPRIGGIVDDPGPGRTAVWRVRRETVELLRNLAGSGGAQPEIDPEADPEQVARAARLLDRHAREALEIAPSTAQALLGPAT